MVSTGESVLPVPFDPPIIRKVDPNQDPVMLTFTGPGPTPWERDKYPRHCQAYFNFLKICDYRVIYPHKIVVGDLYVKKKFAPKIDKYGNTAFNQLLMSHVVFTEKQFISLLQQFRGRKLASLRPNKFGQTPLMLAVESGYPAAVREVLLLKPNLFAKDKEGHDAVDYLLYGTFRLDLDTLSPNYPVTLWRIGDMLVDYAPMKQRAALQVRMDRHMGRVKVLTTDKRWLSGVIP